ncbi:hypothetical protein AVEN_272757-1, partial [Araneus ventricosus]
KTDSQDHINTLGFIYGNITSPGYVETKHKATFVVVDRQYFLDYYRQRNKYESNRDETCAAMFQKIDTVAYDRNYHGASPNVVNGHGVTPLHEAVKRKNIGIIKLLLASGADPLFKAFKGKFLNKSPMDIAEGNEEISQLFLEYLPKDSESEKSAEESQSEQLSRSNIENLSASLQSLTSISESSVKNLSTYTPQSAVHVPPFLLTPLPLITDSKLHLLWPQPQKIVQIEEEFFRLQPKYSVQIIHSVVDVSAHSVIDVWNIHSSKFASLGFECSVENIMKSNFECSGDIICHLNPQMFSRTESYKLIISKDQMRILSSDLIGLHYALCTLEQLFSLYDEDGSLPSLFIHDWPQLQHRAVLLDFAYGARKPTLVIFSFNIFIDFMLSVCVLNTII